MKTLSIRWRMTLWYAAALGVILTAFSVILLQLTRQQLMARTDAALREELQELDLEVRLAKNADEFKEHLRERFFQHDIYDFLVSDEHATILFASKGLTTAQAASLAPHDLKSTWQFGTQYVVGDRDYRIARTTVDDPRGRVVVQAMTPLKPLYDEMQTLLLLVIVLLPLGIAFALSGGYFLAARALEPVKQMAQVAEAITISDLDRRIEVTNPHDELGHLATTLNSLIARLERAVDGIRRFTADASHELRTPLTVLRVEAESALRKQRTPEDYERTLSIVVDEATRLGCLTDQLLSLSRHDAGLTECHQESVRIDALLLDLIEQLRPLAATHGVALESEGIESCEILGDHIRLNQAFFNVMENAIKYTTHGGSVAVQCRVQDRFAVITVRDTGIGIPPQHVERVFERFYRVDSSRHSQTGGTGLGLAISRTAVLAHQGEIAIQSEMGRGTIVTIRLLIHSTHKESEPQVTTPVPHTARIPTHL